MIPELAFFSYRLFGKRLKGYSKRLTNLDLRLKRSGLLLPVEAYFSFMVLVSSIIFLGAWLNSFVLFFVLTRAFIPSLGFSLLFGLVSAIFGFAALYIYPGIKAGKRRRAVEESLPYALSFMAILSSAGVPPSRIFRSLATLEQEGEAGLGGEARTIFRDLEVLGEDIVTELKEVAQRKVSPIFSGVLEGMISTIESGGDLTAYLQEESRSLMRMRRSIMKEFLDTMVMISEMFMGLLVAFPLILIVMLVVMSAIGGGAIAGVGPESLVPLIIYGMVPAAGIVVLLLIDSITPRL